MAVGLSVRDDRDTAFPASYCQDAVSLRRQAYRSPFLRTAVNTRYFLVYLPLGARQLTADIPIGLMKAKADTDLHAMRRCRWADHRHFEQLPHVLLVVAHVTIETRAPRWSWPSAISPRHCAPVFKARLWPFSPSVT